MAIHWIDDQGVILDVTRDNGEPMDDGGEPIIGATAINSPPNPVATNRGQVWDFNTLSWGSVPLKPVTALNAEELYDMLKTKGVFVAADRPTRFR